MAQGGHAQPIYWKHEEFDDLTTTGNDWVEVATVQTRILKTKAFYFEAEAEDLSVRIMGSFDGGSTFPETVESAFDVATNTPVKKQITDYYTDLKVEVQPKVADTHGTLSTQFAGTSL